jgi:glycine/D-amino acid oxidase-like deaminating enzyme
VWLQTRRQGAELDLAVASKQKYRGHVDALGEVFDYREEGGLFFVETPEQGQVLEEYVSSRRSAGLEMDLLSRSDALKRSPLLPDTAIGAVFCADDAQVDPQLLVSALGAARVREGVRIFENTSVLGMVREGDAVVGVRTVRGVIRAGGIVWATGAWASSLRAEGLSVPVGTARTGQVKTEPIEQRPSAVLHGPRGVASVGALTDLVSFDPALFAAPDTMRGAADRSASPPAANGLEYDDSIASNRAGQLYIGSSIDGPGSLNPHISIVSTAMVSTTLERYSGYTEFGITGLWAGLTSSTSDNLPIADRVDGAYVNVGHAWGMASAPVSGEVIAAVMTGEATNFAASLSATRPSLQAGDRGSVAEVSLHF